MNRKIVTALLAGSTILGACAPLSQAALVYSSTVQVGVKVAATSPSNAGPQLSVGYEQVDAAWVPVVVGRPCPTSGGACTVRDYPLTTVTGTSARDNSDKLNAAEFAARDRAVQDASTAVSEVQAAIEAARNRNRDRNTALGELNAAASGTSQPETETETEAETETATETPAIDQAARTARIAELTGAIASEEANITTLNTQLARRQAEHGRAVEAQQEFRSATDQTRTNEKRDALSVFGSFNGNITAGGGTPAGGGATVSTTLNLGKVFSTGVASQNLTEGIEQSAIASALTQCLTAAHRAAEASPEPDRPQAHRTLSLACAQTRAAHE